MTKEKVVKAMVSLIHWKAEEYGLTIEDHGIGHAFDNSYWRDILKDCSGIPHIIAKNDTYKIEIRSFWGNPEIDIRIKSDSGEDLLVLNYADHLRKDDYILCQMEVSADRDHEKYISDLWSMIKYIDGYVDETGNDYERVNTDE